MASASRAGADVVSGRRRPVTVLLAAAILLAACGAPAGPRDRPTLAADLAAHLEATREAQAAILGIWGALLDRQEVSCAYRVTAPPPFTLSAEEAAAFPDVRPVLAALNQGVALVAASVAEWEAECERTEPLVADDVIARGVQTAENATAALNDAEAALAAWR